MVRFGICMELWAISGGGIFKGSCSIGCARVMHVQGGGCTRGVY